jgi:hypothetical protein
MYIIFETPQSQQSKWCRRKKGREECTVRKNKQKDADASGAATGGARLREREKATKKTKE